MQNKNVDMSWDYWMFTRYPVVSEKFEKRGRNTIPLHDHYRIDPKLGKGVCSIHRIPYSCPACVDQLDKYWLSNCATPSQVRYAHVEMITITK